jgi:hypothetical protein
VIKAGAGREDHLQSAFHADLLGCAVALRMVSSLGISNIIVETDASLVKVELESEEYRLSAIWAVSSLISSIC